MTFHMRKRKYVSLGKISASKRKKFAVTYWNEEGGFTLLESLLTLFLYLLLSIFITTIFATLLERGVGQSVHPFEWENFLRQATGEIRESANLQVADEMLTFTMPDGRVATYSQHQHTLRKQVGGRGHEVLLQNLQEVQFTEIVHGVQIEITDKNGKQFKRQIVRIGYTGGK